MKQAITFFLLILGFSVRAQQVVPDPSFGNAGMVITPNTTEITRMLFDADGNIISAGYSLQSGTGIYRLTLTKNSPDGVPDLSFGTNGIVVTDIEYSATPYDMAIQSDGKIVVAGSAYLGPGEFEPGDYQAFAVRYHSDGSLDHSFANNGIFHSGYTDSYFSSVAIGPDHSLFLGGQSYFTAIMVKLNTDGSLQTSFGSGGVKVLTETDFRFVFWSAIPLSDQTLLCVGYDWALPGNPRTAFCKIDAQGNFVSSFGQNGKVIMDIYNQLLFVDEYIYRAKELPDGKILLGGFHVSRMLLKIHADGTPDSTFGNHGILSHDYPFTGFDVQTDGKILLCGSKSMSEYNDGYSVTRLDSEGNLDTTFNGTGYVDLDISPGHDYPQDIRLQSPTKIIVAGSSRIHTQANFTLVRLDFSGNLSVNNEVNHPDISVYPNPFADQFFIRDDQYIIDRVLLFDNSGRVLKTLYGHDLEEPIGRELPAGLYHLGIETRDGKMTGKKIVKQ